MARGAERGKPASRRRHSPNTVPGRLLEYSYRDDVCRRPLVISKAHLRAIRQRELLRDRVTALLRYCGSRNRVTALLRLRSALVLCSPRPHREFAVPTTTPTFLPSALSHLRGYRYVDTACLCKGGFVWAPTTAFVCLPSITAGRAAPNVPYYSNTVAYTIPLSFVFANDTGWPAGVNQIAAHSISRSTEAPPPPPPR